MKKIIVLMFFVFVISACEDKNDLFLNYRALSGTIQLVPKMQLIPDPNHLVYQEIAQGSGQILDSLILAEDFIDKPLVAYVQHYFNQLKLQGYDISDELSQKGKLKSGSYGESVLTLLKTYTIINNLGTRLYAVNYYIHHSQSVIIVSYMTDQLSHRKAFVQSLKTLSFTP